MMALHEKKKKKKIEASEENNCNTLVSWVIFNHSNFLYTILVSVVIPSYVSSVAVFIFGLTVWHAES